jgi:peptidoglycan/LPS O-acetylase OafA/YrhL
LKLQNYAGPSHENNFDLIRLFAASQVVIYHSIDHLGLRLPFHDITSNIIGAFPGVPIFFIVSGFLISSSFDRSHSMSDFFKNRVLRIFPALWLCFGLSLLMIYATGYFATVDVSFNGIVFWALTQLTIVQFYNPDFMRGFGEGVINGSLWTIPVEMQFYLLTPLIFALYKVWNRIFWVSLTVFILANFILSSGLVARSCGDTVRKLFSVTFIPWIYMFVLGFILYKNWGLIERYIKGKFSLWFAIYASFVLLNLFFDIGIQGNKIALPWVLLITPLVLSAAFTKPYLSGRILRRNDISYGMYIYHMPVFNFVIYSVGAITLPVIWFALVAVPTLAWISWKLVERPALSWKKYAFMDIVALRFKRVEIE